MAEDTDRLTQVETDLDKVAGHTTDLAKVVIEMKEQHEQDLEDLHEKLSGEFDEKFDAFKKDVLGGGKPSQIVQALGDKVATLTSEGYDTVKGSGGNDTIIGGGLDTVNDLSGKTYADLHPNMSDTIIGGGLDTVSVGSGDTIVGGEGNDTLVSSVSGADTVQTSIYQSAGADNVG